jgi:hypothetical protein
MLLRFAGNESSSSDDHSTNTTTSSSSLHGNIASFLAKKIPEFVPFQHSESFNKGKYEKIADK